MAIKTSNQITITEHKKIIEIKEWYLATPENSGVTRETEGWTVAVQTMDKTNKYLWNYEEVIYSLGDPEQSDPVVIGVYGETGEGGASLQVKYISSEITPVITNNNVSTWLDTIPSPVDGEKIYMTQKLSTDINWSTPIQISASDGKDGSASVEINSDGYWVINGEITDVKAEGSDGSTPEITIGENGNWYIDGVDSGTKAQGEAGRDGSDIEYVYYRSKNAISLSAPSYSNGILTSGWTANPQGITETYKYEYVSIRNKPSSGEWSAFSTPVIWSKWGEKGQDGDGVSYEYYLSDSSEIPTYSTSDSHWTDEPTGVSKDQQYEYVVQIKITSSGTIVSEPSLWAKYGEDGRGITAIQNYYWVTQLPELQDSEKPDKVDWLTNVPELTPINKYLWNYELITYTDGSKMTDPAIIGAYGDSGTDAVDFQIYSVDGFEFNESINTIELRTVVSQSGSLISSGITYQWKWWNSEVGEYENITIDIDGDPVEATSESLTVNRMDAYALSSIKCIMTYNNISYEDYVTLTEKTSVYTSVIKFFDGSNIFAPHKPYIAAYVEVCLDGKIQESIMANEYYDGNNSIQDDGVTINTDITTTSNRTFVDGDLMYFIYKLGHDYNAVLGEYKNNIWSVYTGFVSKYIYKIGDSVVSNVIVISKEDVTKTFEIKVDIYNDETAVTSISSASAIIIDTNDPIISDTEPTNVKYGQLWLDTSVSPYVLKIYTKQDRYKFGDVFKYNLSYANYLSGSAMTSVVYNYADNINVLEDGSLELQNPTAISIGYGSSNNANNLKGKYFQISNSSRTNIYYANINATVTSRTETNAVHTTTAWYVYIDNVQEVNPTGLKESDWVYFSQQNGGAVYTSMPVNGYYQGDLWIISSSDVKDYSNKYTGLFQRYGEGTMLKATATANIFNESHWTDSMEEVTSTIKNIKDTFSWGDDGLKIMQQVTDSNGNVTNPFYVHIDSTRMGFHSVAYDDGKPDDEEVVHIGINSAVIKNASFVDDNANPDEYSKYEGVDGALFDCNVEFNNPINFKTESSNAGFTFKIESNGSFSLAILN